MFLELAILTFEIKTGYRSAIDLKHMVCYIIHSKSLFKEHYQPMDLSFHSLWSVTIKFRIQF